MSTPVKRATRDLFIVVSACLICMALYDAAAAAQARKTEEIAYPLFVALFVFLLLIGILAEHTDSGRG